MLVCVFVAGEALAAGQTYTVSLVASRPNIGTVVSGSTGDTVFKIDTTGSVTVKSGNGGFDPPASSRTVTTQTVTVNCNNNNLCNSANVTIDVSAGGATGRAGAISHFSAAMGTATLVSGTTNGTSLNFVIGPVGKSSSKNFILGMDFPITSGGISGTATATYTVTASASGAKAGTNSSGATATAYRGMSMVKNADLLFGVVVPPSAGSATVALNALSGTRTVTGTGAAGLPSTTSAAAFTVSGEGGQAISVSVPSTVTVNSGGDSLSITTNNTAVGGGNLSGSLGSVGTYSFNVGGTFSVPTGKPAGSYAGTLNVTVNYN